MTAEIVVLNRSAIALAADSATTLVSRHGAKATNNADKLFQLCNKEPVALMVFGNAEFMDMPLEPLVKSFWSGSMTSAKDTLEGYAEAFFLFLEQEYQTTDRLAIAHIKRLFEGSIAPIISRCMRELFSGKLNAKIQVADYLASRITEELEAEIVFLEDREDSFAMQEYSPTDRICSTPLV